MSSLSDRLKSLGVQVGAEKSRQAARANHPIEKLLQGEVRQTHYGETFVIEELFPYGHAHGSQPLNLTAPLEMMAEWGQDRRVAACPPEGFAFLDTETTGLSGGAGTYAFLVGVGRFEADGFRLAQFFMRDPAEEPALLAALENFLIPCQTVVTFNGKSFDLPLLKTRYISNGAPPPLGEAAHLDLLHLARRLWRDRLPSRTLSYLEEHILGQTRTEDDTPGWMIPQIYLDYLRSGDARPLKGVVYHNAMDILSLAALMELMGHLLADPLNGQVAHALDLVALGKLHEDLGFWDNAARIFEQSLTQDLPPEAQTQTTKRLSILHKRRGEMPNALSLWWQAAADREIYAHIELAKYYEHSQKDLHEAKRWTEAALAILNLPEVPKYEKIQWEDDLLHRLARIEQKISRSEPM